MNNFDIGRRIKKFRQERGMNQAELGKRCGYGSDSQSRISHYERGIRGVSAQELEVFAKALGVSAHEILGASTSGTNSSDGIDDQLSNLITKLNAEQRAALLLFLKSMKPG